MNYRIQIPKFKVKKNNMNEIKAVEKASKKLLSTLETYSASGIPFEKIFNDDTVKHNCLDNDMYVYKFVTQDKSQLRLLYHYKREDENNATLDIITYYMKRKDTRSEYKKQFMELSMAYA